MALFEKKSQFFRKKTKKRIPEISASQEIFLLKFIYEFLK